MKIKRKKKLKAKGWKRGSVSDFLKLTKKEADAVEKKITFTQIEKL